MDSYDSYSGKKYILGELLGEGGEGRVYKITGRSDVVAKIYKDSKFKTPNEHLTMDRKLKTMINMNIPVRVDGILRVAWPLDILYKNGSLAGFVMPCITAPCKIYNVQRADPCRETCDQNNPFVQDFPLYTWKYLVQYAYNLAWVVQFLHSMKIVIGDLNQNNIYADTNTGAVILIDCDSFDIRDHRTGEHFPCVVGLPEMLAPELQQVGSLANGTFTEETDNFSLAIHIFRLLMRNADPFGGVISDQTSVSMIPVNAPIINGECPYVKNLPYKKIPSWAPSMDMLPKEVQDLFQRTFNYSAGSMEERIGNRATASEWCKALLKLADREPNPYLKQCSRNKMHVYPAAADRCPWCMCIERGKIPQPPSSQPSQPTSTQPTSTQPTSTQPTSTQSTSTQSTSTQPISTPPPPLRPPGLYHGVVLTMGLASGFFFQAMISMYVYITAGRAAWGGINLGIVILSILGVLTGLYLTGKYTDRYIYSRRPGLWLVMSGTIALLLPVLILFIASILLSILDAVYPVLAAPAGVLIGLYLVYRFFIK